MGSMLKADSERRELVRDRRQARIARKQERRDARERKRPLMSAAASGGVGDPARGAGAGRRGA